MTVITLNLPEIADEWQERIDEMSASVPNTEGMSWGEIREATNAFLAEPEQVEFIAQYIDLCQQLGLSPCKPDVLRWYERNNNPTIIREDTFLEYAQDFAEDVYGDGLREMSTYIDWERFVTSLKTDYYSFDYDGHTWLRRA